MAEHAQAHAHGETHHTNYVKIWAILLVLLRNQILGLEPVTAIARAVSTVGFAGWIGVDLFFVLSGYLITGILLDSKGSGSYFRNFYMRRILRIFPLYYGVLFFLFVVLPLIERPISASTVALVDSQSWYWTYTTNIMMALGIHAEWFTGHFWSLAVEEQFYLVWPLAVGYLDRRAIARLALGCIVLSAILRMAFLIADLPAVVSYVFPLARMDALATGAVLAILARSATWRQRLRLGVPKAFIAISLPLAAIAIWRGGFRYDDPVVATAGYSLIALWFGTLVGWVAITPATGAMHRILSAKGPRVIGKYSYAMYVFHYPLLAISSLPEVALALTGDPASPTLRWLILVFVHGLVTFALALMSWHLYEKHFLKLKKFFPRGRLPAEDQRSFEGVEGVLPALSQPGA